MNYFTGDFLDYLLDSDMIVYMLTEDDAVVCYQYISY